MLYSNPEFFLLFAATFLLFGVSSGQRWRETVLIAASLFFYCWAGLFDTLIFFFVVAVTWLSAYAATRARRGRAFFTALGITIMVAHLFFWKYATWATLELQKIAPAFLNGRKPDLPLPLGISFFTLQGIAYLIDLSRDEAELMAFHEFLLFKSFFSQLVAGPIVRYHELEPQLRALKTPRAELVASGLRLFCLGFFKKIFIADPTSITVDALFAQPQAFHRHWLWLGALAYSVQIWADFSGYTDMGRGTARMLGINLPENFLSPYLSRSPSEFWKRWHITLSNWIKDYLYKPFVSRWAVFGVVGVSLAKIVTMALSGLWHGANWTFLAWGLYHGVLLMIGHLLQESSFGKRYRAFASTHRSGGWLLVALTFLAVLFGWILFRSQSFEQCALYIKHLFVPAAGAGDFTDPRFRRAVAGIALCAAIQWWQYFDFKTRRQPNRELLQGLWTSVLERFGVAPGSVAVSTGVAWGLMAAGMVFVSLFAQVGGIRSFIYFQF